MTLSPSSSFQDLRSATGLNVYRIPRKPPPVLDYFERYPSPDPLDPFAPLWVLRNRTSSGLPGVYSPLPPSSGPYGSQDTLSNLDGRRYSSSYLESSPASSATTQSRPHTSHTSYSMISSSGSPLKAVTTSLQPKPKAKQKTGHYTPYSQTTLQGGNPVGTLQAFPRITTPFQSRTEVDLASAKSKRPWPIKNDSLETSSRPRGDGGTNDNDDICWSGTDTDDEDAYIKPSLKLKSAIFLRPSTPQQPSQAQAQVKPKGNATHQRAQSVQTNASQKPGPQNRLARFLLPRKFSFLHHGSTSDIPAPGGASGRRSSTVESRPVSKSSISAPQAMVSTVTWDFSRNNRSHHGRASTTPIMKGDEMKCTKLVDMYEDDDCKSSQKRAEMKDRVDTRPTINSYCDNNSPACLKEVLNPIAVNHMTDKLDSDNHHWISSETMAFSSNIGPSSTTSKRRTTTSIFQTLNMKSPTKSLTDNSGGQWVGTSDRPMSEISKITPSPSSSPVEPIISSASNMSNVNLSISAPSFATNPSDDDHVFTSPRPAPSPPMLMVKPLLTAKRPKGATGSGMGQQDDDGCISGCIPVTPTTPTVTSPKAKRETSPPSKVLFPTEWALPTPPMITFAASLPLTCEDGTHVTFGSLFASTRTIVVFIRHFWCPLCQDYMSSLKSLVRPEMLAEWPTGSSEEKEDLRARLVKFVVISNGSHGMIHKYRQIFGLPFKMYTDPKLAVYQALGMGKDGEDCQHLHQNQNQSRQAKPKQKRGPAHPLGSVLNNIDDGGKDAKVDSTAKRNSGGYVKHGLMGGFAMVVVRALKVGMPVWEKGGNVNQLGGEFIFGPGLTCSFAHRMQTTKDHAPIEDVLSAAGIDVSRLAQGNEELVDSMVLRPDHDGSTSDEMVSNFKALPSLPRLIPLRYQQQHRRRVSSVKTLKEAISLSRAASVASAFSVRMSRKGSMSAGKVDNEGVPSRRQTRRYSVGVSVGVNFGNVVGMMSRDEEERWMEQRQISIEKLRERKTMRRAIGRAASAQGYTADVSMTTSEASSVMEDKIGRDEKKIEEGDKNNSTMRQDTLDALDDMEVIGKMDEDLGLNPDSDQQHEVTEEARMVSVMVENARRRSMDSLSDSASAWSRSTAPPPEGGSYVFFHDVVL